MDGNSISIDLSDPRTGKVAEALSNKTCVKILDLLATQELTAGDIAQKLGIPLNTTGYNLDKLIDSGLVEKTSNFFWSVKGKKTPVYRVANRRIIISPKRYVKGIIPAVVLSGLFSFMLKKFSNTSYSTDNVASESAEIASSGLAKIMPEATSIVSNAPVSGIWAWFFVGALFSLIVLFLWDFISSIKRYR